MAAKRPTRRETALVTTWRQLPDREGRLLEELAQLLLKAVQRRQRVRTVIDIQPDGERA